MTARVKTGAFFAAAAALGALVPSVSGQFPSRLRFPAEAAPVEKTIAVPAEAGWVDTGIDLRAGEEVFFAAAGEVNLQKGNPGAVCGPGGIDLVTSDQPIPNSNLGALVGKVVQLVAARVDGNTGAEIRDEIFHLFLIGEEASVTVPFKGRLYLGVNENVLRDNGGAYSVVVTRRPD